MYCWMQYLPPRILNAEPDKLFSFMQPFSLRSWFQKLSCRSHFHPLWFQKFPKPFSSTFGLRNLRNHFHSPLVAEISETIFIHRWFKKNSETIFIHRWIQKNFRNHFKPPLISEISDTIFILRWFQKFPKPF